MYRFSIVRSFWASFFLFFYSIFFHLTGDVKESQNKQSKPKTRYYPFDFQITISSFINETIWSISTESAYFYYVFLLIKTCIESRQIWSKIKCKICNGKSDQAIQIQNTVLSYSSSMPFSFPADVLDLFCSRRQRRELCPSGIQCVTPTVLY